ncbi:MAG: TniQ family protein [Rhodospirillales bacterium]|nr:TniQ family protein [Rhodospirillales bacterium]MDE0711448.1 TniQ family protein [Rhodospirillales bacterium]
MVPHLFPVPPIGVGTPGVESLPGYVSRLAGEHMLQPHFLFRELQRVCPDFDDGLLDPKFFATDARRVDGTFGAGPKLADVLAGATGVADVQTLGMRRWHDVLDPKHKSLFKPVRSWCPECHAERAMNGEPPYEPLLWHIDGVMHCHAHRTRLRTECPSCGSAQPMLAQYGWLFTCPVCDGALAAAGSDDRSVQELGPEERFRMDAVGRLLARHNAGEPRPTRAGFVQRLHEAWDMHGSELGRTNPTLKRSVRDNVYRWRQPRHRPTLGGVLRFSRCTDVDLVWLLDGHGGMHWTPGGGGGAALEDVAPFPLPAGASGVTMR